MFNVVNMSDLISREALLKEVRENKELYERERVYLEGLLLNAPAIPDPYFMNTETLENSFICGYRVKDLIIFGKMFHDNGIKREDLTKYSEAYLDGYKRAYDEINAAINKTVKSIVSKEEVNL